jgi:hypothetical protein
LGRQNRDSGREKGKVFCWRSAGMMQAPRPGTPVEQPGLPVRRRVLHASRIYLPGIGGVSMCLVSKTGCFTAWLFMKTG